jgi:hypothetical protein
MAVFNIIRADRENFRNFVVKVGQKFLIERNEDFHSEVSEWVNGIFGLLKNGNFYFSTSSGFPPFFAMIVDKEVHFETADGVTVSADFYEVLRNTIIFLYEQAKDESNFDRENAFFYSKAKTLLDGFRFRYKDKYRELVTHLMQERLMREEVVVL